MTYDAAASSVCEIKAATCTIPLIASPLVGYVSEIG
jgi:hypothetical protein